MFCPNCGTQNPDSAQTCSKCNFNVKGAAAPKFKGTMLMMNQPIPGAPPGVGPQPAAPAPAPVVAAPAPAAAVPGSPGVPAAPRAAGASSVPSKLKGTMVGVAPMSTGGGAPSPVAVPGAAPGAPQPHPFPPTAPMAAVQPAMQGAPRTPAPPAMAGAPAVSTPLQPPMPAFEAQPPAYAPPHAAQGVNPLGGTVAADGGGFAAFAQQAAAAAAAAPNSPYGQPQAAPGFGGQPGAAPYGAPPGGAPYGAAPNPYGGPPQGGYGAPPQGQAPAAGYGNPMSPQGGMMPYGGAAPANPMVGTLPSQGVGASPTRRNALMTWLLPMGVYVGGMVLGTILSIVAGSAVGAIGTLIALGGLVWYLLFTIQMVNELKGVTGNAAFAWWPVLVPIYNLYWLLVLLPQEVTRAKQMRGVQTPTRNIILYFFLGNFALASDLNDLAR